MADKVEVTLKSVSKNIKVPVKKVHYWYDPEEQEMWSGIGGKLTFVYDHVEKRMKPTLEDVFIPTKANNFEELKSWVNKNEEDFEIEITDQAEGGFITISVPNSKLSDVTNSLLRHKILFE